MKTIFTILLFVFAGIGTVNAQVQEDTLVSIVSVSDSTVPKRGDVLLYAEEPPQFPGGSEQMMAYLSEHIVYPRIAKQENITGRLIVHFIVTDKGEITAVKIMKSPCAGDDNRKGCKALEQEAMRVVSQMPKWKPGMQKGKPVNVYYNLPIKFMLADDSPKKSDKKEERH